MDDKQPLEPSDKRQTRTAGSSGRSTAAAADQPERQGKDLLVPRAHQPASIRFAAPDSKLTMSASVVSKPSQSLIGARTGIRPGPGRPVRVRVIR
jgi:hypothetical protein